MMHNTCEKTLKEVLSRLRDVSRFDIEQDCFENGLVETQHPHGSLVSAFDIEEIINDYGDE